VGYVYLFDLNFYRSAVIQFFARW